LNTTFNISRISSIAIHKEKNILYALLIFVDVKCAIYVYNYATYQILHKFHLEGLSIKGSHIWYDNKIEQLVIADFNNHSIHLVLLPRSNEEKLLIKTISNEEVKCPAGIITRGSDIWVVDSRTNRIQKFALT